ncbi:hypothetical protein [Palleronia sp.]|uniref:hypothetical protein n=1 Tax=Palleronia sp. TaxID=1940284 RepID=UPI0035C82041
MAMSMGPHQPKAGWGIRWVKQALQLALASPAGFLVMILGLLVAALLRGALRELGLTSFGYFAGQALIAAALLPCLVLTINQIMRADGRGSMTLADLVDLSKRIVPVAFAVLGILSAISWAMPPRTGPISIGEGSAFGLFLGGGVKVWVLAEMVCCMANPFWLGSSSALRLGVSEAIASHSVMVMKLRVVWMTAVVVTVWTSNLLMSLPVEILLPILYLRLCWQYVAAREVLGGIDENGIEEKAAVPSFA